MRYEGLASAARMPIEPHFHGHAAREEGLCRCAGASSRSSFCPGMLEAICWSSLWNIASYSTAKGPKCVALRASAITGLLPDEASEG